jgi:hypothetical protein
MTYKNPINYRVNLKPEIVNLGTEGSLDTSLLNGKSIQRTVDLVMVQDCEGDLKVTGSIKDGDLFDNIVYSGVKTWKTIENTAWLYPVSFVNEAIEEYSLTSGRKIIFDNMVNLYSFFETVFNKTAVAQPIGNVGYSIGVGTVLKDLGVAVDFYLESGLLVLTWSLVEQITNQNDLPSGGDSPDSTIGFIVTYCDWDNDGKQDPLDLLPWNIGYENGDPLRVEKVE